MKLKNHIHLTFTGIACLLGLHASAQQSVNSSGGNASGAGGSAAYSVGQAVFTTNTATNGSVAQGVQQAYSVSPTSIQSTEDGTRFSLYPNPTSGNLTLLVEGASVLKRQYQLFDAQGKSIKIGPVNEGTTEISLFDLPSANYHLRILQNNNIKETFQIIKTK